MENSLYILLVGQKIPTNKSNKERTHQIMRKDDKVILIRQLFDCLFDYNDLLYTYHSLDKLPSGGYVYGSLLLITMTVNCYLFIINMSILLCHGTTPSTCSLLLNTMNITYQFPLNGLLSG